MKFVIRKSRRKPASKPSLGRKRIVGPDGRIAMVTTLDANTANFGDSLDLVFKQNVKRARRENKRLGVVNLAPGRH